MHGEVCANTNPQMRLVSSCRKISHSVGLLFVYTTIRWKIIHADNLWSVLCLPLIMLLINWFVYFLILTFCTIKKLLQYKRNLFVSISLGSCFSFLFLIMISHISFISIFQSKRNEHTKKNSFAPIKIIK